MVDKTPRLDLDDYDIGDAPWDHSDLVTAVDEHAIDRGPIADRPASGDYGDELYYATDQELLWKWDADASDWVGVAGRGSSSQPLPGTVHREAVNTDGTRTTTLGPKTGDVAVRLSPDYADSGDGSTTSPYANALQNAHDDLPARGGLILSPSDVVFEESDFTVTKPLYCLGPGRGQARIFDGGSTTATVDIQTRPQGFPQQDFCRFEGFTIAPGGAAVNGIRANATRFELSDVYIPNSGADAIALDSVVDARLDRVYPQEAADAGLTMVGSKTTTLTVSSSAFRQCFVGVEIPDGMAGGVTFEEETIFEQNEREGLKIGDVHNVNIDSCWFERNNRSGSSYADLNIAPGSFNSVNVSVDSTSFGGDATNNIFARVVDAERVRFENCRFPSGVQSLAIGAGAKKVRAVDCDIQDTVGDTGNVLIDGNLATIGAGNDPTTADYDVTKLYNGTIITDDGTNAWIVHDETASDGALAI